MTRLIRTSLLLVALTLPPAAASADGGRLELRTRTLLLGQEQGAGVHASWPVYQWIELAGHDLGRPGLSAHTSLWGFGALGGGTDAKTSGAVAGDVNLLYAQYLDPLGRYGLRVGRQLVIAGPGAGFFGHIDGGWGRYARGGVEAEAWAGRIVQARFGNLSRLDWLFGGRVGYRRWARFGVGLSYQQARTHSWKGRESVGVDAHLAVMKGLDATGWAAWDLLTSGMQEAVVQLRYTPIDALTLGARLQQASPARLLDQTSIFHVFSLGDYLEAGGSADYRINDQWTAGVEYGRIVFPRSNALIGGDDGDDGHDDHTHGDADRPGGHRIEGRVTTWPIEMLRLRLGVERLPTRANGYTAVRLSGLLTPLPRWRGSLDLLGYFYDSRPLTRSDAATQSIVAILFTEYQLREGLHVGAGGELGRTVLATFDARLTLRLTWVADFELGGGS